MEHVLTVTQLTANIKVFLETGFGILWVSGEVSNLRRPVSGHVYFTLKDEGSQVRAVVFRQSAAAIGFDIEEGLSIVCRARLSVYAPRGEYQLIVDAAEPRGIGALQIAFEQLKGRLEAEGLFDQRFKQPLPRYPERIGIVTSPSGAAVRDILNITKRRFPSVHILIAPVRVQGLEAAAEISCAIGLLNRFSNVDVIIVTRGGGSIEDLYPFNDERVARAIHHSGIPVVSAVGHEIDFTIADFAADLRAPTPSAAAEIVVPDRQELISYMRALRERMVHYHRNWRNQRKDRIEFLRARLPDARGSINDFKIFIDDSIGRLLRGFQRTHSGKEMQLNEQIRSLRRLDLKRRIAERRHEVASLKKQVLLQYHYCHERSLHRVKKVISMLESLNPLSVLSRGYSIVKRLPEGTLIKEVAVLAEGDDVSVRVASGTFHSKVTTIIKEEMDGRKEI